MKLQNELNCATKDIRKPLDSMMSSSNSSTNPGWRNSHFHPGPCFGSGTLNMSPAWFQNSHEV